MCLSYSMKINARGFKELLLRCLGTKAHDALSTMHCKVAL